MLFVSVLGLLISALILHCFTLSFDEHLVFRKYSFSYFVLTTSLIRNLPQSGTIGEAEYFHERLDGTKPESFGVIYYIKDPKQEIFKTLEQYLIKNGYAKESSDSGYRDYQYSKGESRFQFSIDNDDQNNYRVIAEENHF